MLEFARRCPPLLKFIEQSSPPSVLPHVQVIDFHQFSKFVVECSDRSHCPTLDKETVTIEPDSSCVVEHIGAHLPMIQSLVRVPKALSSLATSLSDTKTAR